MNTISILLNSLLQLIVFSLIPFIWWLVTARKQVPFFKWIGLKKPRIENKYQLFVLLLVILLLFTAPSFIIIQLVEADELASAQFVGYGISALGAALAYSFIQTGLSEEIFFRGFLTKRLCSKLGFKAGNLIQALIFGIIHGAMLFFLTDVFIAIVITVFISGIGWLLGWVNEKKAGGSIIPSWILHSCANLLVSVLAMFNLL